MMRFAFLLLSSAAIAACSAGTSSDAANDGEPGNAAIENAGGAAAAADITTAVDAPSVDAKVAGTDYEATSQIPCGFAGKIDASCAAGVKREWGEDGSNLVEVTRPDGTKRALFFDAAGKATGADSSQADGSAGWDFKSSRDQDWTVIEFGPERYRVPDALVLGG